MKNLFTRSYIYLFFSLIGVGSMVSSCQKMAGHAVSPTTTTTNTGSSGSITVGATGTFIYKVGTAAAVTCNSPAYQITFLTGTDTVTNKPATLISVYNPTTQDSFLIVYDGIKAGSYDMQGLLTTGTLSKGSPPGVQTVVISSQNVSGGSSTTLPTGTVKGTFTGTMGDSSGANLVSVQGSFNISQ